MKRLAIFACPGPDAARLADGVTQHLLAAVRPHVARLVIAVPSAALAEYAGVLADEALPLPADAITTGDAYCFALNSISDSMLGDDDELLLFDASSIGPLFPLDEVFAAMTSRRCDYWALTAFDPARERQTPDPLPAGAFPRWSFMVVRANLRNSPSFLNFWNALPNATTMRRGDLRQQSAFAEAMRTDGFHFDTYIDMGKTRSADPPLHEPWTLIEQRCPLMPLELFTLDPIVQDAQALNPRRALDLIRERTDFDTGPLWQYLLRSQRLRELQTNLDLVSVICDERGPAAKTSWSIGRVAVLVHLYYPEMLADFRPYLDSLPVPFDLYITTASIEHQQTIMTALGDLPAGKAEVRVVAENRGRDMSALFIGLRDVVLSGDYELALRLHSKRSPQKAAQVSDSFLEHLLGNLLPSRSFIANLFDMLEADPRIGLVIPPAVHVGFTSLGHAWFNNREPCARVMKTLGLPVAFDEHTPVAPYGSMFWFRCAALKPLFANPWRFADYNPEPHYLDGDLAHAQERAIAYVAQAQGYRTETVLSARLAGRYYAKLEYKMQLLLSGLPAGTFGQQYAAARDDKVRRDRLFSGQRIGEALAQSSKNFRVRHPRLWQMTRPVARHLWPAVKRLLGHR